FDGAADAARLIDSEGRLVSGDHIVAIAAVSRGEREVVATVMTNLGTERYLAGQGVKLHRVKVGDRYVFEELRRRDLKVGGEQSRSEEHTSELQSRENLVCRLLLEKKKKKNNKD